MTLEVLLIGLGDEVLGAATEDAQARHLRYAEGVDHLHIIAWSQRHTSQSPVSLSARLTVYPVGHGGRLNFIREALHVGHEIVRRHPIQVISTQEPFYTALLGLCLRRARCQIQIQNHSDFFDNPFWIAERPLWNRALNAFGKWAVRQADRLRVVNTTERQKYAALGLPAERVDVLPVPVDLSAFIRPIGDPELAALRSQLQLAPAAPVLFWVGRPVPVKDLGTLLRAAAIVRQERPEVRFVIGGDFSQLPQWSALATELGLRDSIRFVGPIPRTELPVYFALCSLYLHSSMYEGFGRVMLEASAAGRAIAATRTAGALDIVREGETGLLCPTRNPQAFAQVILELLADLDRARRMGEAGRVWVKEQFDADRLTQGIIEAWRKCAQTDRVVSREINQ